MFVEAIIIGILFGLLRNGNIKKLNKLNLKGLRILLGVLLFDLILRFFILKSNTKLSAFFFDIYPIISILIFIIAFSVFELNKDTKYFRIMQAGYLLNFLPIISNGGKMPVLESALSEIGKSYEIQLLKENLILTHCLMDDNTRFKALGDILPIKFFIPKVISVGDIVIFAGLILFIAHYMKNEG